MDKQVQGLLPFEVGQLAESRSFQTGFRSAWFRCKIRKIITQKKGKIVHALEFFDFPDDKIKWTAIYQIPPTKGKPKAMKRVLMLRPQYPPFYHESQMPRVNVISEVTVVKKGLWKVGDLVDWLTDGCYWSGRITQILGNDMVQIELPPPPIGEGLSYEVFCKDLRPSLDWSPEHGWSVPTSKEGENCHHCAQLIKQVNQAGLSNLENVVVGEGIKNVKNVTATAGLAFDASISPLISASSLPSIDKSKHFITKEIPEPSLNIAIPKEDTHRPEANTNLDDGDGAIWKTSLPPRLGCVRDASAETRGNSIGEDQAYFNASAKKMRTGGNISLNSTCSDTIEAPILDLEELASRVKWLKGILEFGVPLSNAGRPPWKFMEHRASSTQK